MALGRFSCKGSLSFAGDDTQRWKSLSKLSLKGMYFNVVLKVFKISVFRQQRTHKKKDMETLDEDHAFENRAVRRHSPSPFSGKIFAAQLSYSVIVWRKRPVEAM